jgi:hypothetical protein
MFDPHMSYMHQTTNPPDMFNTHMPQTTNPPNPYPVPDPVPCPVPDPVSITSIESLIEYIESHTYDSVMTDNGKILTYFQSYVKAYAYYQRTMYNNRIYSSRNTNIATNGSSQNLYKMLTQGMRL